MTGSFIQKLVNWERKISHWWFDTPPNYTNIFEQNLFLLRFWLGSINSKLENKKAPVCNLYVSAILRNRNFLHKHIALLLFLQAFQPNFPKVFIPFCNKKDNGRHDLRPIIVYEKYHQSWRQPRPISYWHCSHCLHCIHCLHCFYTV